MNIFRNKKHFRKGFTLVEILIAVGIVAVLTAIAIPSISAIARSLHQKQLDDYAQSVYLAAQDHLVSLRKSGTLTKFSDTDIYPMVPSAENAGFPIDASIHQSDVVEEQVTEYSYITSDSAKLAEVLPEGSIDSTVRNGYAYLIEYNRFTGDVYSVFLTDNEEIDLSEGYESLNALNGDGDLRANTRLRRQNYLGYYQGEIVRSSEAVEKESSLGAYLELLDGQEFLVNVYIPLPDSMKGASPENFKKSISAVTVSATGLSSGKSVSYNIAEDSHCTVTNVLDEKSSATELCYTVPFQSLYSGRDFGLDGEENDFLFGENVSFAAKVTCSAADIEDTNATIGNPWFSSYDSTTAGVYVANGRHLQNLNNVDSEKLPVEKVTLSSNINWQDTTAYYKENGYISNLVFQALDNSVFLNSGFELDGAGKIISNLYIDDYRNSEASNTGLFRTFNGSASSLTLQNATVRGANNTSSNVGIFAGVAESSANLEGLKVELTSSGDFTAFVNSPDWTGACGLGNTGLIVGLNRGTVAKAMVKTTLSNGIYATPVVGSNYGMVAGCNLGTVTVSSLQGTLKKGSTVGNLGGAVGENSGSVEILGIYELTADNLSFSNFGGVVGSNSGSVKGAGKVALSTNFSQASDFTYGGVVGLMNRGTLDGFTVSSSVGGMAKSMKAESTSGSVFLGGIVGKVSDGVTATLGKNALDHATINLSGATQEAWAGGLAGYCGISLSGNTLTLTETNINVKSTNVAYAGGLVGGGMRNLSEVQLNSAGNKTNTITVNGTAYAYAGGLAGILGGNLDKGYLLAAQNAILALDVQSGTNSGEAYAGGLLGNSEDFGQGMTLTNSLIKCDSGEEPGAEASDAGSMIIRASANKVIAGGLTATLTGSTNGTAVLKGCETHGVDIRVGRASNIVAGGAVAINDGCLGGNADGDKVSVEGSLVLDATSSGAVRVAGGVVGQESANGHEKIYQNVQAKVALSGWSKGNTAGSIYEDPSGLGISVGQFIGYVYNGNFNGCASELASGNYQFLGRIYCLAEGESSAKYVSYTTPTREQLDTMLIPFRTDVYNTELKVAGYYGLRLADSFTGHSYLAHLANCTYVAGSTVYDQLINQNVAHRFTANQDMGHYIFEPVTLDPKGLVRNGILLGYDDSVDVLIYDTESKVLMSSPNEEIGYIRGALTVTGKKIENPEAFENGIIYLKPGESLTDYRWNIGLCDKFGSVGIFDNEAYRVFLKNRHGDYMVPYYDVNGDVMFYDANLDLDPLGLLDGLEMPRMMYLKSVRGQANTYEFARRGQTALGELLRIDLAPRLDYNESTGKFSVRFNRSPSRFQFLSYTHVGYDENSSGWYFDYAGEFVDNLCTTQKHNAE